MTLRATTNLVIPKDLQLPRKELKSGFLYVYNKGYVGPEAIFINKLWLSSVFPDLAADPTFGKNRKALRSWAGTMSKSLPAGYLTLDKVNDPQDPHFVASFPLASMNRYDVSGAYYRYRGWFTSSAPVDDAQGDNGEMLNSGDSVAALQESLKNDAEATDVMQHAISGEKAIQAFTGLDPKGKAELAKCLIGLRLVYKGSLLVVFADFKISKEIAQQLTTSEWLQIRSIDLYPLLMQWVAGQYGFSVDAPLAAFPVSKIARTLPPVLKGQARVNEFGLSIDHKGNAVWLPEVLDNTSRYEDLFTQVGTQADGAFGLLSVNTAAQAMADGSEIKVQLPPNIPVLIDWVNNKYAFTMGSGLMKVLDLARYKAADEAHVNNLLTTMEFDAKLMAAIETLAAFSGVFNKVHFRPDEIDAINANDPSIAQTLSSEGGVDIATYFETAVHYAKIHLNEILLFKDISEQGDPIWRPLGRYMAHAYAAITSNLDAVNTKYSVTYVSMMLGKITLLAKYANNYEEVKLAANTICSAANNQNVDPAWEPPSIPLLSDRIGF